MTQFATTTGTQAFAERHPTIAFRKLGHTNLTVSQAGFGCYRIDPNEKNHVLALQQALAGGINLIDTSTNYGDGGSETLVGYVLGMQLAGGTLSREGVVIVTKAGYLQGQNYEESQTRKERGGRWPDLVEYGQGLEHCIHPDFLADQITGSLERMRLDKIDILLLHNPEYYLGWAAKNAVPLEEARAVYSLRIRRAFEHLETEVEQRRIGWYGVSSNTFPESADDAQFSNLSEMIAIAEDIRPNHHFAVIQLPFNLMEHGAATERNQPNNRTALEVAAANNLGVLVNRPLNAVNGSILTRLADIGHSEIVTVSQVDLSLGQLRAMETHFSTAIAPSLPYEENVVNQLGSYLSVGHMLNQRWYSLGTYHQWLQTLASYLLPRINSAIKFLNTPGNAPPEAVEWLEAYVGVINETFRAISAVFAQLAREKVDGMMQRVRQVNAAWAVESMSQTALRALRSTPGVSSVLVGMREPEYVMDVLSELARPLPLGQGDAQTAWDALKVQPIL